VSDGRVLAAGFGPVSWYMKMGFGCILQSFPALLTPQSTNLPLTSSFTTLRRSAEKMRLVSDGLSVKADFKKMF
jgi:hypothetical protein